MTTMMKLLAGGAGLAALATAVPASAQYYTPNYSPYAYSPYSYSSPYAASPYGYSAASMQTAESQCTAAVQNRLYTRTGLSGLVGSLFGLSGTSGRVLSITEARPARTAIVVRGLATSGRMAYSPYGSGYYGALGAGYTPDLKFKCDVDYSGYVRSVHISRRY